MSSKILVVDDSRLARTLIKNALKASGFEVVGEAQNGREAIELFSQLKPDLVTMDMMMPEVDGMEATKEIIKTDAQAKVIMITSVNQQLMNEDFQSVGARATLAKPFEPQDLVNAINGILSS